MKIIIITQDEPFYLAKNLKYLIEIMPNHSRIVGCVLTKPSPFGKNEVFLKKVRRTFNVFGFKFFIHYGFKFLISKIQKNKNVSSVLKKYNISKITLEKGINHPESVFKIKNYEPDLLISILGNEIFKKPIIELAPKGCLNLHSALLPKYRGLMPTFWVMKNNEVETGVSVFFVDEGIDSGDIIVQKNIKIGNSSQEELINKTKKMGMDAIIEAINLIKDDKLNLIPNNSTEMTYFSFPTRDDVNDFIAKGKRFF